MQKTKTPIEMARKFYDNSIDKIADSVQQEFVSWAMFFVGIR